MHCAIDPQQTVRLNPRVPSAMFNPSARHADLRRHYSSEARLQELAICERNKVSRVSRKRGRSRRSILVEVPHSDIIDWIEREEVGAGFFAVCCWHASH